MEAAAKTELINSFVTVLLVMAGNNANLILTSAAVIPVNMAECVKIISTHTRANVCQVILERIARLILMIVHRILVVTGDRALIKSTDTNVFVEFHIPDVIVIRRWILAYQIDVVIVRNAHQVPIILISPVVVILVTLVDYATKISMNVRYLVLVAMEQHAKIQTDRINAFVRKVMRDVIVPSTLMIALHTHVKMVEAVWMELVIIPVSASMDSRASIARQISMNVFQTHVKTEQLATSMLTVTHVLVPWASLA